MDELIYRTTITPYGILRSVPHVIVGRKGRYLQVSREENPRDVVKNIPKDLMGKVTDAAIKRGLQVWSYEPISGKQYTDMCKKVMGILEDRVDDAVTLRDRFIVKVGENAVDRTAP